MTKLIVIIRPRSGDEKDATRVTHQWGQTLIDYATSIGYDVLDIAAPNVTYQNVTAVLNKYHPDMIIHFGHGCETYFMGDTECILTGGTKIDKTCVPCEHPGNLHNLNGTIVVAYSCHTSNELGKQMIAAGAKAFVGFSDYLMFTEDDVSIQDVFRDALLPLSEKIMNGYTVEEAVEQTRNNLIEITKQWKPVKYVSVPMYWNYKYMELLGDPKASLSSTRLMAMYPATGPECPYYPGYQTRTPTERGWR